MSNTKEHILNVSFSLFLQKCFKEVTMQEIVEKTGMSKGAFYHYFESKEQLFLEVINHFVSELIIDYNKLNKDSLSRFYHDLIGCLNDRINLFLSKKNDVDSWFDLNYYSMMFDAMKLFPSFREQMSELFEVERKAWVGMIYLSRSKGEIRSPLTDEQIASLFIHTSDGVGMQEILRGNIKSITNNLLIVWDSLYQVLTT
jgi:TetR/AcrR family transcriptional repressor of nem operon